jgi:hypothetical protein
MTVSTPTTAGQILTSAYVNNNINSGLVYITEATTATTLLSFNNCFNSTYLNYRIIGNVTSAAVANLFGFRLRKSGTDEIAANYTWVQTELSASAGTPSSTLVGAQAQTIAYFGYKGTTTGHTTGFVIDLYNPFSATSWVSATSESNANVGTMDARTGGFVYAGANSYDGFSIISQSGNFTCSAKVYGYRQA